MKLKRRDRRGNLGRNTAPLGAIHRSFVSFVSLRGDPGPSGRVQRRIVIPFLFIREFKHKAKKEEKKHVHRVQVNMLQSRRRKG